MKITPFKMFVISFNLLLIFGCSGNNSEDGESSNSEESTISFTIAGNIEGGYIGEEINFTRYNFEYLADNEQNAISISTNIPDEGVFQDIIGSDSLEYQTAHEYHNSIYIRITDKTVGTYSFNPETDTTSSMYLTIGMRDNKVYKSSGKWPDQKLLSITITESSSNRLKGTFTANLNVYYYQDGVLYYDQELSELGQLHVNGEFDVELL